MSEHRANAYRHFQEGDYEAALSEMIASNAVPSAEYKQFTAQCRQLITEQYHYIITEAIAEGDYPRAVSLRNQYRSKYGANPLVDEISIPVLTSASAPEHIQPAQAPVPRNSSAPILIAVVAVIALIAVVLVLWHSEGTTTDYDDQVNGIDYAVSEDYSLSDSCIPVAISEDYEYDRFQEKLSQLSCIPDMPVIYSDGERYIWRFCDYDKTLKVYDVATDYTEDISVNNTYGFTDDEIIVDDIKERNGQITIIITERRNSNGWIEGTSVWTIDCSTRRWTPVAEGVAAAEFIDGGRAVEISEAEILNPWVTATCEEEYQITKHRISL